MKPAIKVEGQVVALGSRGVGIGQGHYLVVDFLFPGYGLVARLYHTVFAGGYYALGLDTIGSAEYILDERGWSYKLESGTLTDYSYDDRGIGEKLSHAALRYLDTVERQTVKLGDLLWNVQVKEVTEALTGQDIRIEYVGGVLRFRRIGWFVDASRVIARHFAVDGDESDLEKKWRIMGLSGSYLEHRLWERQMGIPSISTVNGLQFADQVGIPIYTIDQSNINTLLPTLNVYPAVRQAVVDAVNAGRVVTIPRDTLYFYKWVGSVWIDDLPGGLSTGYFIYGGLLGGNTADEPVEGENPDCASLDAQLGNDTDRAIALFESKWTQFDKDGNPLTSPKDAVGIMQLREDCCPNLTVRGQPFNFELAQTDWSYNVDAGKALSEFHNDRINDYFLSRGISLTEKEQLIELYFQYNSGGYRVPQGGKKAAQVFNFLPERDPTTGELKLNDFSEFSESVQKGIQDSRSLATDGISGKMPPVHEIKERQLWNDPSISKGC